VPTSLPHSVRPPAARNEAFATRLRTAIARKGWSISETARRAAAHLGSGTKFGDGHVWQYVHGRAVPRTRYLLALSRALDLEPHELWEDSHSNEDLSWSTLERNASALSPVIRDFRREAGVFEKVPRMSRFDSRNVRDA
jgi:transcriptional regulator with XRE-family HTH domain